VPKINSIICIDCDAGQELTSVDDAMRLGWHGFHYDPCHHWEFVAFCPDCWQKHEAEEAKYRKPVEVQPNLFP